ncbi:MAG: aminopeptidase P family protein [Rhizobiales bacterium]|nr:aminopeptidase P family protein [Hyphomicrobiales bacterium]
MFETRFQTFDEQADRAATPARLAALRAELKQRGLDGLVVPHTDSNQNEYLPPCEERLAWLTGFTGSAGNAVVLADRAALFVDGRYTLQARDQSDPALFDVVPISETTPEAWIEANVPAGAKLAYDPWLHTHGSAEALSKACANVGASLVAAEPNPLDAVWADRPAPPLGAVSLQDIRYAGEAADKKITRVQAEVDKARADALVISNPTAIAWLLNIRGADVAHTPLAIAFAIVPKSGRPALYIDGRKLSNAVRDAIADTANIEEPAALMRDLTARAKAGETIRLDQASAVEALARAITQSGGKITRGADPITLMKAVKNAAEIAGAHAAHARDAIAMARFLAWFDREAPQGKLTEIECVAALESFRRETGALKDVSFPTIAGAGPNGAIVHYRVTHATNRQLKPGELFLLDSGAQYVDGTTDITRTISIGTPSDEMRDRFTRVLKGHIGIARAIFPDGIAGGQLDGFARQHLWSVGLDYEHGTGHGIGSYLSVHEGPASIHKSNLVPLKRGMILSNEPGYYKTGAYGIRIENLVLVVEGPAIAGADKPLNAFETISFAPIDRRLIVPDLMTAEEIAWLDAYHRRVAEVVHDGVDAATRTWLDGATAPLSSP